MRWFKDGLLYDTEESRLVFAFPKEPARNYALKGAWRSPFGLPYDPKALGVRGRGGFREPKLWETIDGRFFLTANERSLRLNDEMTDYLVYADWADPARSAGDLNSCCVPFDGESDARRVAEPHMTADEYEAAFGGVPTPERLREATGSILQVLEGEGGVGCRVAAL